MIKFFQNLFGISESSPKYKRRAADRLDGKRLRYVTERDDQNEDVVIGRAGYINVRNGELTVSCGIDTLFRVEVEGLTAGELMSLDGVILEGFDKQTQRVRKIIAYYVYYRK